MSNTIYGTPVGTPLSPKKIAEALNPVKTVNGQAPDENGNVEIEVPGGNANGLTAEQISALDGLFKICAYTADAKNAYKAFQTAFGIVSEVVPDEPDPEKTLTSIFAVYSGGDVTAGTAVNDLTGIVVTAHYSDGTSEVVTGYTLSGTIAEGENTITVSYGGKTTAFIVTGTAEDSTDLLEGVEWTNGLRILNSGTVYENQASWTTSDYVAVTSGTTVRFESTIYGVQSCVVSYWNTEKTAVGSGHTATLGHAENNGLHYTDAVIPDGVAYVRVCTAPGDKGYMHAYVL